MDLRKQYTTSQHHYITHYITTSQHHTLHHNITTLETPEYFQGHKLQPWPASGTANDDHPGISVNMAGWLILLSYWSMAQHAYITDFGYGLRKLFQRNL